MPKLVINGQEVEHSGNLIEALQTHPKTQELDADGRARLEAYGARLRAAREAEASSPSEPATPGVTYNGVKYTYAGITGSVLNSGTDYHNVIHTDYGVWEHDNGDGTWAIIYSDGNWWTAGTTTHDPSAWTHRFNPEISDRVMMHWWGNDAHTVEETSGKFGPRDDVTWS